MLWTLFFLVHNGSPEVHYITRQSCRDLVFNKESLALLVCPLLYTEATVHSRTAYSRQAPRIRRQPLLHSSSLSAPKLYASALGYANFNLAARTHRFSRHIRSTQLRYFEQSRIARVSPRDIVKQLRAQLRSYFAAPLQLLGNFRQRFGIPRAHSDIQSC